MDLNICLCSLRSFFFFLSSKKINWIENVRYWFHGVQVYFVCFKDISSPAPVVVRGNAEVTQRKNLLCDDFDILKKKSFFIEEKHLNKSL